MSERTEHFAVGEQPRLEVRIGAGDVVLVAGGEGTIAITVAGSGSDDINLNQHGDTVIVEQIGSRRMSRSVRITAEVPAGVHVAAKLGLADLDAQTTLAGLEVAAGAGDVRVREVTGAAEVATGSGDISVGTVGGRLNVTLASGDLGVDDAGGDLEVKSAAGDVRLGRVAGRVVVRTASGDVRIARFEGPDLVSQSMSGDLRLGIPPGRTLDVDIHTLSGTVRNDFGLSEGSGAAAGRPATLRVKSLSGDVVLGPAER